MPITQHAYGKTSSKLELLTFTFLTILLRLKMTILFTEELCDRNCVVLLTGKARGVCTHTCAINNGLYGIVTPVLFHAGLFYIVYSPP